MVRAHERRYFLSSTRHSTDAFLRRKLGRAFADARLAQTIYRNFEDSPLPSTSVPGQVVERHMSSPPLTPQICPVM